MPRLRIAMAAFAGTLSSAPLSAQAPDAPPRAEAGPVAQRITVSFRETPLQDVVGTFADLTGRSMVMGPEVVGFVTAEIHDQPWDVVLREILLAHGLTAVEAESGIIRVGSQDVLAARELVEETAVRVFRLRWQPAAELEPVVRSILSERGSVAVVGSTNALVVRDVPRVLREVAAILGH